MSYYTEAVSYTHLSTLKWLAILLMLIDHVGASLLEVFVLNGYSNSPLAGLTGNVDFWWKVDRVLRYIGRSAFPIFCFLLVEGAVPVSYTHLDVYKRQA